MAEDSDELRALRERAYGPEADIQDDPIALARLQELESGVRENGVPTPMAAAVAAVREDGDGSIADRPRDRWSAPDWGGAMADEAATIQTADPEAAAVPATDTRTTDAAAFGPGATATHALGAAMSASATVRTDGRTDGHEGAAITAGQFTAVPPGGEAPTVTGEAHTGAGGPNDDLPATPSPRDTRPWWKRRMPLLWAGSVGAALVLGALATLAIQAVEAGHVATLAEDADGEWPANMFGERPDEAIAFDGFHGLLVVAMPGFGPEPSSTCLYVTSTDRTAAGASAAGCSAGSFPATAAILVTPQSPDELLEHFAEGTALQFVLEESTVQIYADGP